MAGFPVLEFLHNIIFFGRHFLPCPVRKPVPWARVFRLPGRNDVHVDEVIAVGDGIEFD